MARPISNTEHKTPMAARDIRLSQAPQVSMGRPILTGPPLRILMAAPLPMAEPHNIHPNQLRRIPMGPPIRMEGHRHLCHSQATIQTIPMELAQRHRATAKHSPGMGKRSQDMEPHRSTGLRSSNSKRMAGMGQLVNLSRTVDSPTEGPGFILVQCHLSPWP